MSQLEHIEKQIRIGVLDALEDQGAMSVTMLARRVEAAADVDDIAHAVEQLADDDMVEYRTRGKSCLIMLAEPQQPDQPKPEPKPKLEHQYGARELDSPLARCIDALRTAGEPCTARHIAIVTAMAQDRVATVLIQASRRSVTVVKVRTMRCHNKRNVNLYGLREWYAHAEHDAPPAAAAPACRADLRPDGRLSIRISSGVLDLAPDETQALIGQLIDAAPRVRALFDGPDDDHRDNA